MSDTRFYLEYNRPIDSVTSYSNTDMLALSGETVYNVVYTIYDKVITWIVYNPVSGTSLLGPKINIDDDNSYNLVGRNVYAYVNSSTNVVFNISGSTSKILTSNFTATTSESSTTNFYSSISNGDWLTLHIISVSGSPSQLAISLALYAALIT